MFRFVTGRYFNALERAILSSSGAAHSKFPVTNVSDGDPARPFKFNAAGANDRFTADLNGIVLNPNFANFTGPLPNNWTVASGTTSQNAGRLQLTGVGSVYQDMDLPSDQPIFIKVTLEGSSGPGDFAKVRVQNRHTRRWLTPGGAWSEAQTTLFADGATSPSSYSLPFEMESFLVTGRDTCTVRLECFNDLAGTGYYDNFELYYGIDLASVHNHNLDPSIDVTLRRSTDNFATTDTEVVPMNKFRISFRETFPLIYSRYWQFRFTGTNVERISIGEAVLAYMRRLARAPQYGEGLEYMQPQDEVTLERTGRSYRVNVTSDPRRALTTTFIACTKSEKDEIRDQLWLRSGAGALPVLMMHHEDDETTLFAQLRREWSFKRDFGTIFDYGLRAEEMPGPTPIQ